MDFNYWQSPHRPGLERLYVSVPGLKKFADIDAKTVKIWIEPSDSAMSGWVIKHSGDVAGIGPGAIFHNRVLSTLEIDGSLSWGELKDKATEKGPQRGWGRAPASHRPDTMVTDRATEAANLAVESIQMAEPVTIQVDHREPQALIQLLEAHPMITVERVSLDLGDIQVEDAEGNSLVIERKRCDGAHTKTDFESSVVDGRLFDQSERLKLKAGASDHQCIPIILLEGDLYTHAKSMLCQQIDGAISFLCAIQKMSVLPCLNQNHTAYVIAKLASHFKSGLFASVSLHKAKPKAIFEQKAYALESLPGVSSKTAEALLLAFGSVRAVMTASRTELLKVPGMGPKRVDALLAVLGD